MLCLRGPFQLAIHMVQNRRAGEQKSHWDKTDKGNYHLKLCMCLFVLSQCYFCSPVRQFCTTRMVSCKKPIFLVIAYHWAVKQIKWIKSPNIKWPPQMRWFSGRLLSVSSRGTEMPLLDEILQREINYEMDIVACRMAATRVWKPCNSPKVVAKKRWSLRKVFNCIDLVRSTSSVEYVVAYGNWSNMDDRLLT